MSVEARRLVANLLTALVVALGVIATVYVAHTYLAAPEPPQKAVEASTLTPAEANDLRSRGWRGLAGDGAERLYPPHTLATWTEPKEDGSTEVISGWMDQASKGSYGFSVYR